MAVVLMKRGACRITVRVVYVLGHPELRPELILLCAQVARLYLVSFSDPIAKWSRPGPGWLGLFLPNDLTRWLGLVRYLQQKWA